MTNAQIECWQTRLQSRYIHGRRIRFLDEGNGPAIILLHGIPTHSYLWRDVVNMLRTDYRVIVPDLPGFGFSDRPDASGLAPAGLAATLSLLLDDLGINEYGLVGHDYGALVACELLSSHDQPVSSLTITNTSLWREDWSGSSGLNPLRLLKIPLIGEISIALARPFILKQAFRYYFSDKSQLTGKTIEMYWHPFTIGFRKTLLQLYRSVDMTELHFDSWRRAIQEYDGPSQVVWGLLDPTFTETTGRSIARLMQPDVFHGLKHSNHFVPEDRPQSLSRFISNLAS